MEYGSGMESASADLRTCWAVGLPFLRGSCIRQIWLRGGNSALAGMRWSSGQQGFEKFGRQSQREALSICGVYHVVAALVALLSW